MGERRDIAQHLYTISIPRDVFVQMVVCNQTLSKKDYRVLLFLLTKLNGFDRTRGARRGDPGGYIKVSPKAVAEALFMDKEDIKKSLKHLEEEEIIERGSSDICDDGYRFTF